MTYLMSHVTCLNNIHVDGLISCYVVSCNKLDYKLICNQTLFLSETLLANI
jgi:hypothetical protein